MSKSLSRVYLKDWTYVHVDPIRRAGGLILHAAVPPARGYTTSHVATAGAVFSGQPLDVAEEFFKVVSQWPEWEQINNVADAQFLKPRVLEARQSAKLSYSYCV